ncbi:ATP-binding response regulator [Thioflexithrix psekupsensis]|uniref:histidine kinase n=1 Tax=Thioflexithrix psekupsensis TaxID=1570016 RepID=A0A251X5G9_9GAMM|nr:hybrid sensor histidine kinase/response regulator [Thioflexithrix psekupsensis]OUD12392.1 hybrid sensor histidine kinase/response regulator [Thioflexithrix psekupsensis]
MIKPNAKGKDTILIVDDTPDNMLLLHRFLTQAGFRVLIAQDGKSSIETVNYGHPDMILLDVMMPNMDGFAVCEQLKSNPETQDIPIIFMTALTDTVDKVHGFELGAADYITKPFQHEEVLARITAHLKIYKLQQQLQQNNLELDAFAHTVAHDLKTPLSGLAGLLELLSLECQADQIPSPRAIKHLELAMQSVNRTFSIVDALLLLAGVSRQQQVPLQTVNMTDIIIRVQERLALLIDRSKATIIVPEKWPNALGNPAWIEEIWSNYLSNGLKYGGTPPHLTLGATMQEDGFIRFWIRDQGDGLSKEQQKSLFTPFTRLKNHRQEGHGLGLSIVQRIAERLQGAAGVESEIGQGCLFYFTLPKAEPE